MSGSTYSLRWRSACLDYAAASEAAGLSSATVDLRVRAVTRFASTLQVFPWELTPEEYQERLRELPQSPYRTAMRSFYRWATRAGRTSIDPTLEASKLPQVKPAPPAWESAIGEFETAMHGAKYQPTTIDLRTRTVRLFAVDWAVPPYQVTPDLYRSRLESLRVAKATRLAYRTAVRAFYRWAHTTGRVMDDPTAEPNRRTTTRLAAARWEEALLPFSRYLRALGQPETTIRLRLSCVRRLALILGDVDPFKVTTDQLLDALATKRDWQSETRRSHVDSLRAFYRWAKVVGRSKKNPAKAIPAVRRSMKAVEPASEAVIREALAKASPRERLAIRLAAELGLRRGEVAVVHSTDLTGSDGEWWLLVHGKGNKERRLPVHDDLAHVLVGRGEGYAFPGTIQGHLSAAAIGDAVNELFPAGVTMHKLRHRFATKIYGIDHDVFALQGLLGHASPATTRGYVRMQDDRGRRLVELANRSAIAG